MFPKNIKFKSAKMCEICSKKVLYFLSISSIYTPEITNEEKK